jgi:hypothetical protein
MAARQGAVLFITAVLLISMFTSCDERQTFQPLDPVDKLLQGRVTDDLEMPLSNVEVSVYRQDIPIGTGASEFSILTDNDGRWEGTVSLTSGRGYAIAVTRTGYIDAVSNIFVNTFDPDTIDTGVIALPGTGFEDELRIVLTWDVTPSDLDAHLTGPAGDGSRFHIYWDNRNAYSGDNELIARLTNDRRTGYGPETIAIYTLIPGIYRYTVHNYSANTVQEDSLLVTRSEARVRVFDGNSVIASFSIGGEEGPENSLGNAWQVFEIDGTTGEITFINQVMDGIRFDDDTAFRLQNKPYGISIP